MTDEQARAFPFKPFDLTKVWPKAAYPLIEVGFFELNRNPENIFAEVEQVRGGRRGGARTAFVVPRAEDGGDPRPPVRPGVPAAGWEG